MSEATGARSGSSGAAASKRCCRRSARSSGRTRSSRVSARGSRAASPASSRSSSSRSRRARARRACRRRARRRAPVLDVYDDDDSVAPPRAVPLEGDDEATSEGLSSPAIQAMLEQAAPFADYLSAADRAQRDDAGEREVDPDVEAALESLARAAGWRTPRASADSRPRQRLQSRGRWRSRPARRPPRQTWSPRGRQQPRAALDPAGGGRHDRGDAVRLRAVAAAREGDRRRDRRAPAAVRLPERAEDDGAPGARAPDPDAGDLERRRPPDRLRRHGRRRQDAVPSPAWPPRTPRAATCPVTVLSLRPRDDGDELRALLERFDVDVHVVDGPEPGPRAHAPACPTSRSSCSTRRRCARRTSAASPRSPTS